MNFSGYEFEGFLFLDNDPAGIYLTFELEDKSGVYVIVGLYDDYDWELGKWHVVDVGEAEEVKDRVESHERKGCWESEKEEKGYSHLVVFALYTGEESRMKIEKELRKKYNPPCGKR